PTWYRELRPIYGPFEAALERFVDLAKSDFIGREAALREKESGGKLRRVTFVVDATDADVVGDEPIWHDGKVIGWVTSGGYGHYVERSLAQGYVPRSLAGDTGPGAFEIEILGERRAATLAPEPLFDPQGRRMRGCPRRSRASVRRAGRRARVVRGRRPRSAGHEHGQRA